MMRPAFIAIVTCALGISLQSCSAPPAPVDETPSVALSTARNGSIVLRIEARGRVGPPSGSSAKLAFAEPGILQSVAVRVGQTVRAGDAVAQLDRAPLAAPLAQARADARAADASYAGGAVASAAQRGAAARLAVAAEKLATLERGGPAASSDRIAAQSAARQAALKDAADDAAATRAEHLFTAGVIARKELDAARAALESDRADRRAADARVAAAESGFASTLAQARADVASARSDLETARTSGPVLDAQAESARARVAGAAVAYDNGTLAAAADGVVIAILKHPGEAVDSTTPVIEIGPAAAREITLAVPGDSAQRIAPGTPVLIEPASGGAASHGRVLAVVPAVDPLTRVTTVVTSGAPADAISGDGVTASITVGTARGVLVPASAIVEDPQTGKTVVFVHVDHPKDGDSAFALRVVDVRTSDATTAAITTGLRAGERVATSGGYLLLAPQGG